MGYILKTAFIGFNDRFDMGKWEGKTKAVLRDYNYKKGVSIYWAEED